MTLVHSVYSYRVFAHPLRSYPGPFIAKLTDWYGAYHAFNRRLHHVTYEDHRKYGRVIRQGPNKLVFNSVEALHDIYFNDRMLKSSTYLVTQVAPNVYNTFNAMDKSLHRVKRRIIGQGLNDRAIRKFEPVMLDQISIFLKEIAKTSEEEKHIDMTTQCTWLGYDISGELGFGRSFDLQTDTRNRWLTQGISMSNYQINIYLQFPDIWYTGWEALLRPLVLPKVQRYRRMLESMITARLAEEKHALTDLFSFVSDYKDQDTGHIPTTQEIWSEAAVFIPAGGDTTSTLITICFFYLSRYPSVYRRLADEIRNTFTSGDEIKGGSKLSACTYLRAVVDESLRVNPPGGFTLWRDVPNDGKGPVIVDGHVVPPGTRIGVNMFTMHHNEVYFREPFRFKPERWIAEESGLSAEESKRMHGAFIPFSAGSRGCAGRAMAYLEASLVIAKTLWYFDFDFVDEGKYPVMVTEDQLGSRHTGPELRFRTRREL